MPELTIELHLTAGQVESYYRGETRAIQARATNGQTVRFPASVLRKFVTFDGVHGRFLIEFDEQHKFVRLERLSPA